MDIFTEIRNALAAEEKVVVATIIGTSGSTPAPLLSKMLVTQGGRSIIGTVGGGCTEGDILLAAGRVASTGTAEIMHFVLDEEAAGMICGGSIDVLVEPVTRHELPVYERVIRARADGVSCVVETSLDNGMRVRGKEAARAGDPAAGEGLMARAVAEGRTLVARLQEGLVIAELIEGAVPLVVFGGGHIGRAMTQAAAPAGFMVTVVDDRPKYADPSRFPEAAAAVVADFASAGAIVGEKRSPFVLIATRGHRHDEEILRLVVGSGAAYIGMIGSKRKVRTIFDRLLGDGIGEEQLRRVHAPMGIAIGAVTPEEIAVSVVAEMIAVRRGLGGGRFGHLSEGLLEGG